MRVDEPWLSVARHAQVAHNAIGCLVSLNDMCDRTPQPLNDGDLIDIGGKRLRLLETPHVPHAWEAQLFYEETTATLLCGDLFTPVGDIGSVTTDDIVAPALDAEDLFHASSLHPSTGNTLRRLAGLEPARLALMHGASFDGDGGDALRRLTQAYNSRVRASG
jgi:flavorubredoxin